VREADTVSEPSPVRRLAAGRPAYGNLKDEAASFIRDAIVGGDLPPRSKIDQDEIAGALGFSRAPVREALIELTQKGFVLALPRRGAFVAEVSAEDIEDHYAVVALVFGMTTRRAIKKLTAADVGELRDLDHRIATASDAGTRRELDRRFFHVIVTAGRSRRLDSLLAFLGGAIQGSFYFAAPDWGPHEAAFRQHLISALEAGDTRAAVRTSEEHMRGCAALTIAHLRAQGYWQSEPDSYRVQN
jgi:DNA-binding GntR family transcriptional regulator